MIALHLFGESFAFAIKALVQNKLRSILSLLGITIGIFSIIAVFTFIDSFQLSLQKDVNNLGSNVIYIEKWPWTFGKDYPWWKYWDRPQPTMNELEYIQRKCKSAEAAAFTFGNNSTVEYLNNSVDNVSVNGITDDYNHVVNWVQIDKGRYFTPTEFSSGTNVAIIGCDVATGLFGDQDAIGKSIKVMGRKVLVVAVMKKQGESKLSNINMDVSVLMPANFERTLLDMHNKWMPKVLLVKAREGVTNAQLISELRGIMRSVRELKPEQEDNFALNESSMVSKNFNTLFDIVAVIGWVIGGFSILVGGIGIANIMFVSVKERTSLIGIQKSLGAKNYFILMQFIIEAVLLSLIGGLIGILIDGTAVLIGNANDMGLVLTFSNVMLGITISVLIGLISGFIPAYTASQLDPVEAIRSTY